MITKIQYTSPEIPISLIVCVTKNMCIGKNGGMIRSIKPDMQRFINITSGKPVIMGYNTYMSLPGRKPLANRVNIILSKHMTEAPEGFSVANSMEMAISLARQAAKLLHSDEIMIIGGAKIYEAFMPLVKHMYITVLEMQAEGDTYFPSYDNTEELWQKIVFPTEEYTDKDGMVIRYHFENWNKI